MVFGCFSWLDRLDGQWLDWIILHRSGENMHLDISNWTELDDWTQWVGNLYPSPTWMFLVFHMREGAYIKWCQWPHQKCCFWIVKFWWLTLNSWNIQSNTVDFHTQTADFLRGCFSNLERPAILLKVTFVFFVCVCTPLCFLVVILNKRF